MNPLPNLPVRTRLVYHIVYFFCNTIGHQINERNVKKTTKTSSSSCIFYSYSVSIYNKPIRTNERMETFCLPIINYRCNINGLVNHSNRLVPHWYKRIMRLNMWNNRRRSCRSCKKMDNHGKDLHCYLSSMCRYNSMYNRCHPLNIYFGAVNLPDNSRRGVHRHRTFKPNVSSEERT